MSGDISQKYAGVLDLMLTSPKAVKVKNSEDATKKSIIKAYYALDESDLDKLREFRIKVLGFHGSGLLSRDDAEFFVNKTVDPFTQQKKEAKGWFTATMKTLQSWHDNVSPTVQVGELIDKLLNRVDEKSTEEAITKAGQDIIIEEQKAMNPNKAQYKLNETYDTPLGPAKVIGYDDDGEPILDNARLRELTE